MESPLVFGKVLEDLLRSGNDDIEVTYVVVVKRPNHVNKLK